jgi:hypothetical protein
VSGVTLDAGGLIALDRDDPSILVSELSVQLVEMRRSVTLETRDALAVTPPVPLLLRTLHEKNRPSHR